MQQAKKLIPGSRKCQGLEAESAETRSPQFIYGFGRKHRYTGLAVSLFMGGML
jgi:hypothetical protein